MTTITNMPSRRDAIVQILYDIAGECEVSIEHFDGEPLDEFADRLVAEIGDKIAMLDEFIQEIGSLDIDACGGRR